MTKRRTPSPRKKRPRGDATESLRDAAHQLTADARIARKHFKAAHDDGMKQLESGNYKAMSEAIDQETRAIEKYRKATEQMRIVTTLLSKRTHS